MDNKRELILDEVDGLANELLFYHRRNDTRLPVGSIEEAIKAGTVSIPEIVSRFRKVLIDSCYK